MTPTPCPVCHLPGGFHDNDDAVSRHHERVVPRELVRPSNTATRKRTLVGGLRCIECTVDEDPAPWCDCQPGETCGDHGPCRRRAHHPRACPTPGRW